VLRTKPKRIHLAVLHFSEVTLPGDAVVLILIIEHKFSVDVVVDDFLSAAVLEVVGPLGSDGQRLNVVMEERVALQAVVGPHVHVEAASEESQHDHNNGINPRCHNEALAKLDVPNLKVSKSLCNCLLVH
jgi:hypothetical protein